MGKEVQITGVAPLSPHNQGLYEAGKTLLVESVEVGRDFCKTMVTVATGAIPIYVALLGLAVGKDFRPSGGEGFVLSLAPGAFLLSAAAFAIGYFPKQLSFSLDRPDEIETARTATVTKRLTWSRRGFVLLLVGIALAAFGLFYGLSVEIPSTRAPA